MRAFLEVLLGLPSSKQTKKDRAVCNRKKGLFGTCVDHCTCYECQGRGSLHFHGLFWGGIPPWLLDMVVGNSELVKAVATVLDQQICAALDAHIHQDYEHRLKHKVEAPRMLEEKQLLPPLPDDPHEAAREIEQFASKVFGHIQIHRCLITSCGKPPGGKSGCRFGLPRAAGEGYSETRPHFLVAYHTPSRIHNIRMYESEVEFDANDEKVSCVLNIWELRRPHPCDGRVVETNKLLAYLYASNTNVQFLGGEDVLVAVAKYVVGYCSKNPVRIANVLSTIRQVTREVDKMDTTEFAQPGEKEALLLKRIINSLDKKVEFSAQMAAVSLLGYPSWHCSHKFAVVHPWSTVTTIPTLFSGMLEDAGGENTSDDEGHANLQNICVDAPSISSSVSDVVDDDPLATSNVDMQQASQTRTHPPPNDNGTGSSEDDQEDNNTLVEHLNSLTMDVAQSDADATCRAYVYTVGEGLEARQIAVTPAINYACRGRRLRALCALEYYCLIKIEQRRATDPIEVTDGVNDGRPENAMFDFHPRHVLDDSNYVQYLVSQSRCPILAGKRMPVWPGVDGSARTRKAWAKFVMCNFVPWDIKVPPQITWNHYLQREEHCKTAHAGYLERSRHSMVVRLKKIGHYDRLRKSLTDDIRKRCRKIWGVRHPLDIDFNAGKEMAELKETRTEVKDTRFAEAVQDMQEAIQRAQNANKRGRSASSEQFDILKEALNLQLGLAPAMSHASREKETKFLYALGDDDHCPHGDDIYSLAQRVFDDIRLRRSHRRQMFLPHVLVT